MGQRHAVPPRVGRPALALVTLIPLVWLVAVTFTASVQKIWHPDPRIGFLAQAHQLANRIQELEGTRSHLGQLIPAKESEDAKKVRITAMKAEMAEILEEAPKDHMLYFNNVLDAAVAGIFLVLVTGIIFVSVREWILLLSRRKLVVLHETEPVWLPEYAVKEAGPNFRTAAGAAIIVFGLVRELSGESHFERARQQACASNHACESAASPRIHPASRDGCQSLKKIYVETTEWRFNGVRRCC